MRGRKPVAPGQGIVSFGDDQDEAIAGVVNRAFTLAMAGMLSLVLAAVVTAASAGAPASAGDPRGAQVRVAATVTILRAELASETPGPGGLTRHVSRRRDGSASILFE